MSAHIRSFPTAESYNRDLSDFELWERSLRRSVHRREITELARKHAARRKGAAIAVTASMAAGPTAAPFAAAASGSGSRSVATASGSSSSSSQRSAIELPSNSLVSFGDTGDAVAAVQREVGVVDDGIFGPITRGAVSQFQKRYGLPVTGSVDARTWSALFKSNISFVGGGGKTVTTVSHGGSAAKTPGTPDDTRARVDGPDDQADPDEGSDEDEDEASDHDGAQRDVDGPGDEPFRPHQAGRHDPGLEPRARA